jgi:hypothetical protein
MPVKHVRFGKGFSVVLSKKRGQAASMVIANPHHGRTPLKTLNLYVPPAYRSDGNEPPRGRGVRR